MWNVHDVNFLIDHETLVLINNNVVQWKSKTTFATSIHTYIVEMWSVCDPAACFGFLCTGEATRAVLFGGAGYLREQSMWTSLTCDHLASGFSGVLCHVTNKQET